MTKPDAIVWGRDGRSASGNAGIIRIPGGAFRMGPDSHDAEETPAHSVAIGAVWIDRTPLTNRDFHEFVRATGYVTFAEIAPDRNGFPGALSHLCAPNDRRRSRTAARHAEAVDTSRRPPRHS